MINKREGLGINHFNDPKAFTEYSNDIHDVYKNIDECNPYKENKILVAFDDMIADMIHNKKINSNVTDLFIRGRKLNISLVFITQSYFKVPKDVRLNTSHFFIAQTPNKRELQQIAINHSSDINTKNFANIYRKCTAEPYSFLVIDTMLASSNPLKFRKNLFNILIKIMTINDQIKDEKIQYDINREAAKILALSSGEIRKYECLTGEDILPSNQQQIIEQAKFTFSPLRKAFEKQIKTIEDQGKKHVETLSTLKSNKQLTTEDVIPKKALNNDEAKKELHKIKEIEKNVDKEKLIYETDEYTYSFKNFQTIKTFGRDIYESKITIKKADEYQADLLLKSYILRKIRNQGVEKKTRKRNFLKNLYNFFEGRGKTLDAFESKIFLTKSKGAGILNPGHSKVLTLE